jgi:hypothetical protein
MAVHRIKHKQLKNDKANSTIKMLGLGGRMNNLHAV